ncbi:hypothetical protein FKM82_008451 [Ascaphus truei]
MYFLFFLFTADRLKKLRTRFIEGVNIAVINGLLDRLFDNNVISDGERELVTEQNRVTRECARCLFDMVTKKGNAASKIFISCLQEEDPVLSRNLDL